MSVTKITSIHCDGCGDWEYCNITESAADVRRRLARVGWLVGWPDPDSRLRKDFCTKCRAQVGRGIDPNVEVSGGA